MCILRYTEQPAPNVNLSHTKKGLLSSKKINQWISLWGNKGFANHRWAQSSYKQKKKKKPDFCFVITANRFGHVFLNYLRKQKNCIFWRRWWCAAWWLFVVCCCSAQFASCYLVHFFFFWKATGKNIIPPHSERKTKNKNEKIDSSVLMVFDWYMYIGKWSILIGVTYFYLILLFSFSFKKGQGNMKKKGKRKFWNRKKEICIT